MGVQPPLNDTGQCFTVECGYNVSSQSFVPTAFSRSCNTTFLQPVRRRTSRIGSIKDWSAGRTSKKTIPYYSQLDYVLCRKNFKRLLVNSRSHGGTLTTSDHKMVIARFSLQNMTLAFLRKKTVKRLNSSNLSCATTRANYNAGVRHLLDNSPVHADPNEEMKNIFTVLQTAAEEHVGFVPKKHQSQQSTDPRVVSLSEQRKKLRLDLNSNNASADRSELRRQINKCQSDMKKRLKYLDECKADADAHEVNTGCPRAMFTASRQLAGVKRKNYVSVHDSDGNMIGNDAGKAAALKDYFQEKFTSDNTVPPLDPFDGPPRPLTVPITSYEVEAAAKGLKNGRATGPDGIPSELVKYANQEVFSRYAACLNSSFMLSTVIDSFGQGNITPLQKPKKPLGPPANVRPVTVSNCSRKLLSVIILRRIQTKLDTYTGATQCGYKRGKSCGDIVWSTRMLLSVVVRKRWSYYSMGLDMSSAFDTIDRQTILNVLGDVGCTDDEIRLVRLLLTNTILRINVAGTLSIEFQSTTGAFQGDASSGNLFTKFTEAAALIHLRAIMSSVSSSPYVVVDPIPNPPISIDYMPLETEYSDDMYFNNTSLETLQHLSPIAKSVFEEYNLFINPSKTEYVHFYLADPRPKKKSEVVVGATYRGDEPWRTHKTLGSLVCSEKDIKHRCILGNVAFRKFENIWLKKTKISLSRKLMIYEAQVVSIIMYNCNSWAAPTASFNYLDVTHRRHLRSILNIKWPTGFINNSDLYKRCDTTPLSTRVAAFRWRMLGHTLRGVEDSPAYLSMLFAINAECNDSFKGRRGRPCLTLLDTIRSDLKRRKISNSLRSISDFENLRVIALDRVKWKSFEKM